MTSNFDIQKLQSVLKDFYAALGIRISIVDDEFNPVIEYPESLPAFCRNIRQSSAGLSACKDCDRAACLRAQKRGEAHIYTCHAGLTEAITPIQLDGGVIGYAILAHMMPVENYQNAAVNACRLSEKYGVEEQVSRKAIKEITPRTMKQIHAAARVLDALAAYVQIRDYAHFKDGNLARDIEVFVSRNLGGNLSSEIICNKFHCSRSGLYALSKRAFGCGIMQYVNARRIELAKKLLKDGKSISEVASACGFEDYSYFCRVFRRAEGCSPGQFLSAIGDNN